MARGIQFTKKALKEQRVKSTLNGVGLNVLVKSYYLMN